MRTVLETVVRLEVLPSNFRDHPVRGDWNSYRELHIESDWLFLYRIVEDEAQLARTGTQSDLFRQ